MTQKRVLLKGAFILTIASLGTKLIGFGYRIFLSRYFGEESVGLYQLILPLYGLGISLCCSGIQIAISRTVASNESKENHISSLYYLYAGFVLSVSLSTLILFALQKNAAYISEFIVHEPRCKNLLIVLSYTFPFSAIHCCICGYYIGLKKAEIPAFSQFLEQCIKVLSVCLIYRFYITRQLPPNIIIAVIGIVLSEMTASLYCILRTSMHSLALFHLPKYCLEILQLSIPLTSSRILLNILQSIEAISIPHSLRIFGYNGKEALILYGVLTGMALPCILFPSAITNSAAAMLVPTVAELQTEGNSDTLHSIIKKTGLFCFGLGFICCIVLFVFNSFIGDYVFHSEYAGKFIQILCWICPFLYTNNTFLSIINGLGKTLISFFLNCIGLVVRILGVFIFIPLFGMQGYLWGLLASQLLIFVLSTLYLIRERGTCSLSQF